MRFTEALKKYWLALLVVALVALCALVVWAQGKDKASTQDASTLSGSIEGWESDSPAMKSIVEFVEASADESSEGYIPQADRVAVFDMDGTLFGERFPTYFNDWLYIQRALYDDSYEAPEDLKAFARAWEAKVLDGVPIDDFDAKEREMGPQLYEGLTPDEYVQVVQKFRDSSVWGFEGMTYGEAFFQPMVALVRYLSENGWSCYVVSATYRDAVRVMCEGVLGEWIPADRVIGTDLLYVSSGDENQDSMFYELEPSDELEVAGSLFIKNQKTNKATAIQREIGRVPVLAFGNSTGDFSMATYTLSNQKYEGRAYMLLCDDTERDYGDPKKAAEFKQQCEECGFATISEKDEFTLLYPEGVKKTAATKAEAVANARGGESAASGSEASDSKSSDSKASSLDDIKAAGVLRVGTAGDYQPMSYLDPETGTYVGFDAELAEDLAASLGVKIEWVKTSWPTLMEDTLAGKFDVAICGITVTDARKEQALMSDGYLANGKTVLCRAEDANKYTSLEAINKPEVRVMENPGGLNEKFARENLPNATLIIHDVNQEIPGLVAAGEADVMITEIMEAGYYVGQDARLAAPLIYEPFTNGQLGALMPKGSDELLAYVNDFLAKEKKSGRIDELAEEYIYRYVDEELDQAA